MSSAKAGKRENMENMEEIDSKQAGGAHVRAAPTGTSTGTPSCTRAAGDVGPYHGCPVNTMRPCRPRCVRVHRLVGRDVLGAPRPRGRPRGRHRVRGPPGTSAPTTPHPRAPHGRARRPRRAAPTGTPTGTSTGMPTGTRAAGDVGPYQMDDISESFFRSA